ncbi:MAG: dTMP kinase [Acidimicrobiales bacterium]|nr:dTMP kinase [Acidimicrobiales bacterium]
MTETAAPPPAKLIAFEGGEGTGKSTQAARLAERLGARFTFEPGDTPIGQQLRRVLLDPEAGEGMHPRAEALLMAADRAQHVAEVVRPCLEAGQHVVTDRYLGSSLVYQGLGRGLGVDEVWALSRFATDSLEADVVVLLEVPPAVQADRLDRDLDRLERAGDDFHERVRTGFGELAERFGWVVVDGVGSIDEVEARVWAAIEDELA